PVRTPQAVITLRARTEGRTSERSDPSDVSERSESSALPGDVLARCMELYEQCPRRPLTLQRPEPYFRGWAGWEWAQGTTEVIARDDGYTVLRTPEKPEKPARLIEARSAGPEPERQLVQEAAHRALSRGISRLTLEWLPSPEVL